MWRMWVRSKNPNTSKIPWLKEAWRLDGCELGLFDWFVWLFWMGNWSGYLMWWVWLQTWRDDCMKDHKEVKHERFLNYLFRMQILFYWTDPGDTWAWKYWYWILNADKWFCFLKFHINNVKCVLINQDLMEFET